MRNLWKKFIPLENLAQKYSAVSCIYTPENLLVVLSDSCNSSARLYIRFEAKIFSYQKTGRALTQNTATTFAAKYNPVPFESWALFEVENSSYAEWISKESLNIFGVDELLHFAFVTTDHIFEFITAYPPTVSFTPPVE